MNLILFTAEETARPLPRRDPRAAHLLATLRRQPGDSFDCGLVNGPRGKGTLTAITEESLLLSFAWGEPPPPPDAIGVIIGLPRPQTSRDILRDTTTLGVARLDFVATEKSERSYAQSTLWSSGEWRRHVLAGAEQAFDTRLPEVSYGVPLADVLARLLPGAARLALDNYEAATPLSRMSVVEQQPVALALGPERGWTAADRALLRAHDFAFVHLGSRVLRVETAVVAALTLVKSVRGSLR
ncbi:MAG: 16S rRNA (uracil(1498)-N(3))-methyltransferase [Opitutae bacterium]|nr:16S rRNA (uracil(1498)-N(3))-methyltransferase [Opitutae bacterium]